MFWERDEWPSLRSSGSLSIPSLCSLLTWPPFIFDLSGSSLVLVFYASSSSSFSLLIHHFYFTSYSVLTVTSFWGLIFFSHHHYTSRHQFGFSSLHHHCYHVHSRHLQVHGSRYFLYMLHFIHEGMGFDHWVFGPSFPSFLSPYHPNLRYVLSLKTILRPWHHTLCLIALMWAILGIGWRAFWLW